MEVSRHSNPVQFSMLSQIYLSHRSGKTNGLLRRSLNVALLDRRGLVGVYVLDFIARLIIYGVTAPHTITNDSNASAGSGFWS